MKVVKVYVINDGGTVKAKRIYLDKKSADIGLVENCEATDIKKGIATVCQLDAVTYFDDPKSKQTE
jgi:hypothetical protein